MQDEKLSPLTQVGFSQMFDDLIFQVNKDYGFNLVKSCPPTMSHRNDLTYDCSSLINIALCYCGGYGNYTDADFKTNFVFECTDKSLEIAKKNLEVDLRKAMDKIVKSQDESSNSNFVDKDIILK